MGALVNGAHVQVLPGQAPGMWVKEPSDDFYHPTAVSLPAIQARDIMEQWQATPAVSIPNPQNLWA